MNVTLLISFSTVTLLAFVSIVPNSTFFATIDRLFISIVCFSGAFGSTSSLILSVIVAEESLEPGVDLSSADFLVTSLPSIVTTVVTVPLPVIVNSTE